MVEGTHGVRLATEHRGPAREVQVRNAAGAVGVVAVVLVVTALLAGQAPAPADLDARVTAFLESHRGQWRDLNVPYEDGRALYDLIVERRLTRGLEIGTSTGHSGVWIGWAFAKTGGKLITVDVDERRYRIALANFEKAGVARFIDARLADAHVLVPQLPGPFDFVFIDADKDWYTNYAKAVLPKLTAGGCLTAHNVSPRRGWQMTGDFYDYVTSLPDLETQFRAGVMVSCKK